MLGALLVVAAYASKQKEAEDRAAQQIARDYLAWNSATENEIIGAEMKFAFTLTAASVWIIEPR